MKIYKIGSNILLKYFIFCSFLLILPIFEIFITPPILDDGSLEKYGFFVIFDILISFFILNKLKIFKDFNYNFFEKIISDYILIIITIISFLLFYTFIHKYIHSIEDILLFASKYRQGFYKGSGIFTWPILIIIPFILSIIVIKQKRLTIGFYFSLLLVFIATIIVGLRIYLFGIVFLLLIRLLIFSKIKNFIIVSIVLFLLMFLYKFLLNTEVEKMNILQIIGYMVGRNNFRSWLYFNGFSMNFDDLKCMIFPINYLNDCSVVDFKQHFAHLNPKIPIGMPFIAKYSGVTISIPKILYNLGSPIFLIVLIPYIILIIYILHKLLKSNNIWLIPFWVNLFITLNMALLEDIQAFNKFWVNLVIGIFISVLFYISKFNFKVRSKTCNFQY